MFVMRSSISLHRRDFICDRDKGFGYEILAREVAREYWMKKWGQTTGSDRFNKRIKDAHDAHKEECWMIEIEKDLRALEKKVSHRKGELENRVDFDMSENTKADLLERVEQIGKVHEGLELAVKGLEPTW
jgi:hypothetical protein